MATLTLLDGARTLGRTGHFAIGVHWLALLAAAALLNGAASLRRLLHARTAGK
jgi:hypothetical protein